MWREAINKHIFIPFQCAPHNTTKVIQKENIAPLIFTLITPQWLVIVRPFDKKSEQNIK